MDTQKSSSNALWFSLGMVLGTFLAFRIAGRRADAANPIDQMPAWERALTERYGVQKGVILAAKVQAGYHDLFKQRPRFRNAALRMHLEARILPGIALYRVLLEESGDQEQAIAVLEGCFKAQVESAFIAQMAQTLDKMPGCFGAMRVANRLLLQYGFPEQGWKIKWVEDNRRCIAYDITGCFYLNILTQYGVPEITKQYCALDDLMYKDFKTIAWERTETLGRGNSRCNFIFRSKAATRGI